MGYSGVLMGNQLRLLFLAVCLGAISFGDRCTTVLQPNAFKIYDSKSDEFYLTSYLEDGTVYFGITTRVEGRRASWPGYQAFDQMVSHYGSRIKAIAGDWTLHKDNFAEFKRNLDEGMTPEDAARNTWTGRNAKRYGFTKVTILEPTEFSNYFFKVRVLFERD